MNERVTTVEGKVSSLNELVSTGENNLLDRVNTIETDYVTSGNLESAINGIDLSAYLLKADLTKSRIQSTLGISDWALAATKPSYAWSEITSRPTALSQFTDDVVAGKYLSLNGTAEVNGDITANKFIGYLRGDIIYDNGVDEGHFIGLGSNGVGVKGLLNYVYGNFPILFYTNGFERMRIGDYVGIGTTSPTERLDVGGNIKASGNINATSITINGVTITASNGSITVNGNVLATGSITAKKSA